MSCPDCFQGHVHSNDLKGQITTLHGFDVYVAEPSDGPDAVRGIVIIIPDAFGWEFVNSRILADRYAEKGKYKVYLPDFMNVPSYHVILAAAGFLWFLHFNKFSKSWPLVRSFATAVRQNEGARLPIAAAGFCWGGKHTVNLAHGVEVDGRPLINAAFTGHPSLLDIPGEIEKIKIPTSFAMGELDRVVKIPQVMQIKRIVEGNDGVGEVKVYYGANHGFCVREDPALRDSEKQAVEAEDQALDWFNRHFARVSL
ncbi:hypothetical protein EYZ11_005359 [Aspergillus tanneri]|uniref:Dienelactone hydrolase domain-containing protein n=1 Tax=Aspergillus tanneri TaxID=1220188 RepID=A0A4S3JI30_9EURO|nr:hypothetical protein EYZ11_005359 [Aspergillus tanneri]